MFSSICVWINGLVNNREVGDLRRHRAHHDVTVMTMSVYGEYTVSQITKCLVRHRFDIDLTQKCRIYVLSMLIRGSLLSGIGSQTTYNKKTFLLFDVLHSPIYVWHKSVISLISSPSSNSSSLLTYTYNRWKKTICVIHPYIFTLYHFVVPINGNWIPFSTQETCCVHETFIWYHDLYFRWDFRSPGGLHQAISGCKAYHSTFSAMYIQTPRLLDLSQYCGCWWYVPRYTKFTHSLGSGQQEIIWGNQCPQAQVAHWATWKWIKFFIFLPFSGYKTFS